MAFTIAEFPVFVVCFPTLVYILVHRNWVFAGQESRGALPHTFLILITLTDVSQLCKYLLNLYYTLTFDRLGAFTYKYQLKTQKISATVTKLVKCQSCLILINCSSFYISTCKNEVFCHWSIIINQLANWTSRKLRFDHIKMPNKKW